MYKAIFLDRDGTINEDVGDLYSPDRLVFIPKAIEALRILQERFLLFIITNQSGIGKDIFSESDFIKFNHHYINVLTNEGVSIKKVYYCPHTKEENCTCRKPSPYFLKIAEKDYSIDLKGSFIVGDHPYDIEMANKVWAGSVYLLTGHGKRHRQELLIEPDYIADSLYMASEWIMKKGGNEYG